MAPPRVLFNCMSHEDDWVEMRAAVRLTRAVFAQSAFALYCGPEFSPRAARVTDAEIDDFLREEAAILAETGFCLRLLLQRGVS